MWFIGSWLVWLFFKLLIFSIFFMSWWFAMALSGVFSV